MSSKTANTGKLHVLDSHKRVNFLHQTAAHISLLSESNNDACAKISRMICNQVREVMNTERIKVHPDFNRTICKKCKQMLISKVQRCKLELVQKKILKRTCLNCNHSQNYEMNKSYLSRNEKAALQNGN